MTRDQTIYSVKSRLGPFFSSSKGYKVRILTNKIAFKVKRQAEKSILQGHPWVYESSIIKQNKEGVAGDIAIIFDQRKNQFLAIGLFDPKSVIRIRILKEGKSATIDESFFSTSLSTSLSKRKQLLKTKTTAYRLCYGENDGLPGLVIDIYNKNAVIKLYSEVWTPYLKWLETALLNLLPIESIILRLNRNLQRSLDDYFDGQILSGVLESEEVIFFEHGLKFKANLIKGHKTGYFLDHRHNRLRVRGLSKGKNVLDVFSYAGGFSVNALAGGAKSVISLDISAQALEIASSNVKLNFEEDRHSIMPMDAFEGIKLLRSQNQVFDLIIVDPPSFAKSEEQIERAKNSYKKLLQAVIPLINKKGILLMASCSSRISKEVFFDLANNEVKRSGRKFDVLQTTSHDIDHPEKIRELSYLKSIYFQFEA